MTNAELNEIKYQIEGCLPSVEALKLLRSIEIAALREAANKLDQSQTDTPVSDLRCMATELEKL